MVSVLNVHEPAHATETAGENEFELNSMDGISTDAPNDAIVDLNINEQPEFVHAAEIGHDLNGGEAGKNKRSTRIVKQTSFYNIDEIICAKCGKRFRATDFSGFGPQICSKKCI